MNELDDYQVTILEKQKKEQDLETQIKDLYDMHSLELKKQNSSRTAETDEVKVFNLFLLLQFGNFQQPTLKKITIYWFEDSLKNNLTLLTVKNKILNFLYRVSFRKFKWRSKTKNYR